MARDDRVSTDPFYLAGGSAGCLLVHGFTGNPYEMRFLGEELHRGGYTVSGIRLAGHGGSAEEMQTTSHEDWFCSVRDGLERLLTSCTQVFAVGLSLGSLLVLRLAREFPDSVLGVGLLAPAVVLRSPGYVRLGSIMGSLPWLPEQWRFLPKPGSDIADPEARRRHPSMNKIPLRCLSSLLAAQQQGRAAAPHVRQPALVIQGALDRTVDPSSLDFLSARLPNLRKAVLLPNSRHVITVDAERHQVVSEVLQFLDVLRNEPSRGQAL